VLGVTVLGLLTPWSTPDEPEGGGGRKNERADEVSIAAALEVA